MNANITYEELINISYFSYPSIKKWAIAIILDNMDNVHPTVRQLELLTCHSNKKIICKSLSILENIYKSKSITGLLNKFENNNEKIRYMKINILFNKINKINSKI